MSVCGAVKYVDEIYELVERNANFLTLHAILRNVYLDIFGKLKIKI